MAEKMQPGEPGWVYEDKVNGREWTFGEIAALYGGNEYMTEMICGLMEGQDPAVVRDALEEHGAIEQRDHGGYAFTYYDTDTNAWDIMMDEVEALVEFWMPKRPAYYDQQTQNGYNILERYEREDGRLDILAAKPMKDGTTEYVVGHNYDVDTGSWGHGTYRSALADAVTAWDENRGIFAEKTLMVDGENEHRSIAVAVPEGYLVATAQLIDGLGTGEVNLELWDREGEFVSSLATIEKADGKPYRVLEFDLGDEDAYDYRTFTGEEFSELPPAWLSETLKESVQFPPRDPELDKAIVEDALEAPAREPGVMIHALGKPRSSGVYVPATPSDDMKTCSESAAARGAENRAPEIKRQK